MINKIIKAKIQNIDIDGYAYIKQGRDTIKVKGCNPNELVQVKVIRKTNRFYIGELLKVLQPCNRNKQLCNNYKTCGSCSFLQLDYNEQLRLKKNYIVELCKNNNLRINVNDVVASKNEYEYRNKIILAYKYEGNKLLSGMYEENSHRVINCDDCMLHDDETNKLISDLNKIIKKYKISIYNEDKRRGLLRHILIRKAFATNEYLICLVTSSNILPGKNNIVKEILNINSNIKTIVMNVNTRKTSVVLGEQESNLYGKGFIVDKLCGYKFKISSKSFYQINHDQCENLYTKAISLLKPNKMNTLLDAYCGIGTIGMIASSKFKNVIGVEINTSSISYANFNAKLNEVNNITFIKNDAGKYLVEAANKREKIDSIIMDPARDGSSVDFINSIFRIKPKDIVYISCNVETLIRDLKLLSKEYKFKDMHLYDMFPNTSHVECVVLMSRVEK